MRSKAETVDDYLRELPDDRREAIGAVREMLLDHLPRGYEEAMQYGMISYHVPLSRYPVTYNGQPLAVASLASQKGYMALYLMGLVSDAQKVGEETAREKEFRLAYAKTGKKLDMGKACIRFKSLDDLALPVIAAAISSLGVDDFIDAYEKSRTKTKTKKIKAR